MSHWHNPHTSSGTQFPINNLAVKIKATWSDTFHLLWTSLLKSDWRSFKSPRLMIQEIWRWLHYTSNLPYFVYKREFLSFSSSSFNPNKIPWNNILSNHISWHNRSRFRSRWSHSRLFFKLTWNWTIIICFGEISGDVDYYENYHLTS